MGKHPNSNHHSLERMVEETRFKISGRREIRSIFSLFIYFFMFYSHTLFPSKHLDLFCCLESVLIGSDVFVHVCVDVNPGLDLVPSCWVVLLFAYCLELQTAFREFFSMSRTWLLSVSFTSKPFYGHHFFHIRFSNSTSCQ